MSESVYRSNLNMLICELRAPDYVRICSNWRGMKSRAAVKRILELLGPVRRVVEPFGGTGSFICASPATMRRYNDHDPGLVALARKIQADPHGYIADCKALPRKDPEANIYWQHMQTRGRETWNPSELAWATTYTFGGRLGGRVHPNRRVGASWKNYVTRIPMTWRQLQGVDISCMDWRDVLAETRDYAVYADPPYDRAARGYLKIDGKDFTIDYGELFRECQLHPVAVVSGYAELSGQVPDGWRAVTSPAKVGRKRNHWVNFDNTEVDWVWERK